MKTLFKLLFFGLLLFESCNFSNKDNSTLNNHPKKNAIIYSEDSLKIINLLKNDLKIHKDFFFSKEYFDSTQIIIDTIIYNPDHKKFAVFVITKNPTSRQLIPDKRSAFYYDGTLYLGAKKSLDSLLLSFVGPTFTNSIDKTDLRASMRSEYFSTFGTAKDQAGNLRYKCNLGDTCFWNCPIWKEIETREFQRREYEIGRKKNPDNYFVPLVLLSPITFY